MANKYSGLKRKALKDRWSKLKRIEKNNLPKGVKFQFTTLNDLRGMKLKAKAR